MSWFYMCKWITYRRPRQILMSFFFACLAIFLPQIALSQTQTDSASIDPRLEDLVQIVKSRVEVPSSVNLDLSSNLSQDEINLGLVKELQGVSYSRVPQTILDGVSEFNEHYDDNVDLRLDGIVALYMDYVKGLEQNFSPSELQDAVSKYTETGNWFEKYIALEHSSYLHGLNKERQAALQKAQLALSIIPENSETNIYAKFAKSKITSFIAHLHNLQGNSSLALSTSLEYLQLTENNPNPVDDIDLINNLIYAYGISRDHDAQLYLSEQLLKLEQTRSSNVPGLSEMRIAGVMNDAGRFDEALNYAEQASAKAKHPSVMRTSKIFKAIALAGMDRPQDARAIAYSADVNFTRENMLNVETRKGDIYLAFLLAQKEEPAYATRLFNRQLDIMAQKYLSNNARDTTTMLAELENSREHQAERDAAAAREADLQALTIDRQRKLNQSLVFLIFLLGGVSIAAMCFARYRSRIVKELEIKTEEAASAEKLKTDFLGMISHELRTPLNGIIGISDFLAHYHEDPDIRKKTGIVLKSGQELLSVVESLTDMARLDAGQLLLAPHDANLSASLAAVSEPWAAPAQEKGLAFTHFVDPAITEHHIDEERLLQCLNILLSNAIRFTNAGRVHLHITAESTENEITGLTAIVADTGQGMSELVQSRLFTPFMQADTSLKRTHMGTGLSLAIAYALAEKMSGTLSVFSREGRGSEFKLQIPLAPIKGKMTQKDIKTSDEASFDKPEEGPAPEAPAVVETPAVSETPIAEVPVMETKKPAQSEVIDLMQSHAGRTALHDNEASDFQSPATSGQHILVVDNHIAQRRAVVSALKSQGHKCSEAADGFAALDLLDQMAFDIIILDVHMTPIDGAETLRRLRNSGKSYADIPVIVVTASEAVSLTAACMEVGADLFLTKPVREDELLQTIDYLQLEEQFSSLSKARA